MQGMMQGMITRRLAAVLCVVCAGAVAGPAAGQDLVHKAPPQERAIIIANATIHPVSGPPIERGFVAFENGKITAVGSGPASLSGAGVLIDATGKHVYPGLIAPDTQLGLAEIATIRASNDFSEIGNITPEVRAAVAVNPDSWLLPVTRKNGILTFVAMPSGGLVPGRASVLRMDGWTWETMAIKPDAGLLIEWPAMRPVQAWWMERPERDQMDETRRNLGRLDEVFDAALAYFAARNADPSILPDVRYEAMRAVFPPDQVGPGDESVGSAVVLASGTERAQNPLFIAAQDVDQINAAVTWAAKRRFKVVIVGGREATLAADLLKKHDVAVILQGTHRFPRRDDSPYDEAFTLPAELEKLGIRWCMASSDRTAHERNLPYNAATAAAYGLDPAAALRSVTLSTAEILGVGNLLGSLEPGKSATLFIADGSPLEIRTRIERAFIDGRQIDLASKQSKLEAKYREKYRQLGLIAPVPGATPTASAPGGGAGGAAGSGSPGGAAGGAGSGR